jgi:hypothetical protein
MARRTRSQSTPQLALEWTEALRWEDLPSEVRDELRDRLRELLLHVANGERCPEGAGGE